MPIVFAKPVIDAGGNDSFTKVLVHSDTTNGSTTMTDSAAGATPHTLTANGGAQHSTDRQKFGATSIRIQAGTQYISTPDNADLTFGSGDFAVDAWVNYNIFQAGNILASQFDGGDGNDKSWLFGYINTTNKLQFTYTTDGISNIIADTGDGSFFPNLNQWYHLAVARDGANLRMFVDGTQLGTTYNIASDVIHNASTDFRIGSIFVSGAVLSSNSLNGYVDEFRTSIGTPRYTANFTPETAPYTP